MHLLHPVVTIGYPVAGRFVAGSHHHERGVMTVLIDDTLRLLQQVLVNRLTTAQLHTMIRPRRTFRLQVHTHTVGSSKSRLGGTVAMEAHMVEAILLALLEDTHPLVLIGWGETCLWKTAVLHRATQKERTVIDIELTSLSLYLAQAELCFIDRLTSFYRQAIQIRMELIPEFHIAS